MTEIKYHEKFPENDTDLGYICGLIATDGCLEKVGLITLYLKSDYIDTVKYVSRLICIEGDLGVRTYKSTIKEGTKGIIGSIRSKSGFGYRLPKLYQYCLDMGITPRKSLTLNVKLDDKSDEFKLAFLRGVIDGDGTVYLNKKGDVAASKSYISVVSASPTFLKTLKMLFNGSISTQTGNNRKNPIHRIEWRNHCIIELAKSMPNVPGMHKDKSRKLSILANLNSGGIQNPTVTLFGENFPLQDLLNKYAVVSKWLVRDRIRKGWSLEESLFIDNKGGVRGLVSRLDKKKGTDYSHLRKF